MTIAGIHYGYQKVSSLCLIRMLMAPDGSGVQITNHRYAPFGDDLKLGELTYIGTPARLMKKLSHAFVEREALELLQRTAREENKEPSMEDTLRILREFSQYAQSFKEPDYKKNKT
jgi:hypothetical protein